MVKHYIITNRETSNLAARNFIQVNAKEYLRTDGCEEAQDSLRYGTVTFDPKKAKKLADFEIYLHPDLNVDDFEKIYETGKPPKGKELGSTKVFTELYEKGKKADTDNEHTLVFIHGFKSDLEVAMQTMANLHKRFVENPQCPVQNIVMFTWPAMCKILRYRDDARDSVLSGYALARSFASFRDFLIQQFKKDKNKNFCEQKIHLMCHSMGNRVLESMVTHLQSMGITINSVFSEILLVAADIDYDALEQPKPLYKVIDLGERVHVYYHNGDKALGLSENTKNAFNRLGRWGAKNTIGLPDDIYQAEVSDIRDDDGVIDGVVHHWYYYNSKAVSEDIAVVLAGGNSVFTM
ncbi:MAG TPA: alpha/beta hydrolase [Chryseosolibacter sp.]